MSSTILKGLVFLFLVHPASVCGQLTWRAVVGALGQDEGTCIRATPDGNAVVVGNTGSFGNGSADAYMVMMDATGEMVWSRVYGGSQVDRATALCIDPEGNLLIAGFTNGGGFGGYDGWVFKTDPQGAVLWERSYGGPGWDFFQDIEPRAGGGWLLSGSTASQGAGAGDGWLLAVDEDGIELFDAVFGGSGDDQFRSAVETADGGVVAAGARDVGSGDLDAWVVKLQSDLSVQWEQFIGGDSAEVGQDVLETLDGGFSVVGTTRSASSFVQHLHFKLDSDGDSLWAHLGGGQVNDQEAIDHVQSSNGRFAIVGYTRTTGGGGSDMYLQLSDPEGDFIVGHTFGLTEDDAGNSITETAEGYFACGSFGTTQQIGAGNKDMFIVRVDTVVDTGTEVISGSFDATDVPTMSKEPSISIFPNPASSYARLSGLVSAAHLLDPQGRLVRSWSAPVPVDLDLRGLCDGAYRLVTVTGDRIRASQALIIAGN